MVKCKIINAKIRREVDSDPDTSYLGKYSSQPGADDVTIDRQQEGDMGRNEYRYFIAAMSGKTTGNPDSVRQDYERMEAYNRGDWCLCGIYATAEIWNPKTNTTQKIRSGGLWGIESDSDKDYFEVVKQEELNNLRAELASLGFGKRAIDYAFKLAEKCEA